MDEVVVIAAHPDDETLGAGGLIALCHDSQIPVRVVCVTDGGASQPDEQALPRRRAAELTAAVTRLAPNAPVTMLGFPDGETREHRAAIAESLAAVLDDVSENAVLVVPWRGDGHRDHRVVGEIAIGLAGGRRVLEYPIWMWHWAGPDHHDIPWDRLVTLAIDPAPKTEAIECFTSQTTGDSPILRPDFLEHFQRSFETFIVDDPGLGQDYFDALYRKSEDPWRFHTRWYEQRKRAITTAVLPHDRYRHALEIGCSIGVLSDLLASRCDHLLAVDISVQAAARAKHLLGMRATVQVQDVTTDFPRGEFDLIVLSEVAYYWDSRTLSAVLAKIRGALAPAGVLLACHWRHPVPDYPLTGDEVHARLAAGSWHRLAHHLEDDFVLDVYSLDGRSIAQREGLA